MVRLPLRLAGEVDFARDNHGLLDALTSRDRSTRLGDKSFVQRLSRLLSRDLLPGRAGRPTKNENQYGVPREPGVAGGPAAEQISTLTRCCWVWVLRSMHFPRSISQGVQRTIKASFQAGETLTKFVAIVKWS